MLFYLLIVVIIAYLIKLSLKPANFPPGPPRFPILGSLPFLKKSPKAERKCFFHFCIQLAKDYGKIVGIYIGKEPAVIISDFNLIKDILKMEDATNRPITYPFNEARYGHDLFKNEGRGIGIVMSQGEQWRENRRFVSRNLRDFGFGKNSMEDLLLIEVEKIVKRFSKHIGDNYSLNQEFNISIINSLWVILVGENLDLDDPKLKNIVQIMDNLLRNSFPISPLAQILPSRSLLKLPGVRQFIGLDMFQEVFGSVIELIRPYLENHIQNHNPGNENDLLDILITHMENMKDKNSSYYGNKGIANIYNVITDLFFAGTETTSTSLVWTFLYMIHHPDIQERVFKEIEEVVGLNRLPNLEDRKSLPFTNAVLEESFRITGLTHSALPHHSKKEIKAGKYIIPANTTIFANLYNVMNDNDYWKEPEKFNPDRFINSDGNFVHDERIIPFSIGKRYCMGQALAEKEFYLFFAGIIQNFKVISANGQKPPPYHPYVTSPLSMIRSPPYYEVQLLSRQ